MRLAKHLYLQGPAVARQFWTSGRAWNLRPCVRRNFPNFLFLRVSEKFGCRSLEIFRKKRNFWTRKTFPIKKLFENVHKFQKFWKKNVKFEFLCQKTLFMGQKVWKKFRKNLEKVRKFWKLDFPNVQKFRKFWKLLFSKLSKIYEKMTLNSNFGYHEKLVPTQKLTQKFGQKFGMQGLP